MSKDRLLVFSGNANKPLTNSICRELSGLTKKKVKLGRAEVGRFKDGELRMQYQDDLREADVFIVQPTNQPDRNLIELLAMIRAARSASARRVTAVIPYFGYARQDRKDRPRTLITARLVVDLLVEAGAHRVLTMDLHASQIQGFFPKEVVCDHIYARRELLKVLTGHFSGEADWQERLCLVATDAGAAKYVAKHAEILRVPMAIVIKDRPEPNVCRITGILGAENLAGRIACGVDDMVDTLSTADPVSQALKDPGSIGLEAEGAIEVWMAATHGLLSGQAVQRLQAAPISRMFLTDSVRIPRRKRIDELTMVPLGRLLAEAILCTHKGKSLSSTFEVSL